MKNLFLANESPSVYIDLVSSPVVARRRKLKARWRAEVDQELVAFSHTAERDMKQIKVNKIKLLDILKKNRDEHRGVFLEAQTAFRLVAIEALDAQLKEARDGNPFELHKLAVLRAPVDHTADYDRSIQMLEMHVDDEIIVNETEFQNYVQDIWDWSRGWAASNMQYVSKGSRGYGKLAALARDENE